MPELINAVISEMAPEAICDRCLFDRLKLSSQAHAAQTTAALGTTSDFVRERGACSVCGEERIVIRATTASAAE